MKVKLQFILPFFLFLFLILPKHQLGQSKSIDSLLMLIEKPENDTSKVLNLLRLGIQYRNYRSVDSAIVLFKEALSLSQNLKYTYGEYKSYRFISGSYIKNGAPDSSLIYNQRGYSIAKLTNDGNAKAAFLHDFVAIYTLKQQYETAEKFAKKAEEQYKANGALTYLASLYSDWGVIMKKTGNYERAVTYYKLALKLDNRHHTKATILLNLGNLYKVTGRIDSSIYYLREGIVMCGRDNDYTLVSTYVTIGAVFQDNQQLDSANFYLEKSLDIAQNLGPTYNLAPIYTNLGSLKRSEQKFQDAINYLNEAIRLNLAAKDSFSLGLNLFELANLYYSQRSEKASDKFKDAKEIFASIEATDHEVLSEVMIIEARRDSIITPEQSSKLKEAISYFNSVGNLGYECLTNLVMAENLIFGNQLKDAIDFVNRSLQISIETNNQNYIASANYLMGEIEFKRENFNLSISWIKKAINSGRLEEKSKIQGLKMLANSYEELGHYKESSLYWKEYAKLEEHLRNASNAFLIAEFGNDINNVMKDRKLAEQQLEISITKLQRFRDFIIFITLSLIGIILLAFFYYRNAVINKSNEILSKKNQIIIQRNKQIKMMNMESHHRIKNNLNQLTGILAIMRNQSNSDEFREAILEAKERIHILGDLHQSLSYNPENPNIIRIDTYLIKIIDHIGVIYKEKNAVINVHIGTDFFDSNTALYIGLLVNEILTNSLKHAFHETQYPVIDISLYSNQHLWTLTIKDNGAGINRDEIVKRKGIGLGLIELFTESIGGDLNISSNLGAYFEVSFINKYEPKLEHIDR